MKTLLLASPRMSTPKTEISLGRHPRGEKPAGGVPASLMNSRRCIRHPPGKGRPAREKIVYKLTSIRRIDPMPASGHSRRIGDVRVASALPLKMGISRKSGMSQGAKGGSDAYS